MKTRPLIRSLVRHGVGHRHLCLAETQWENIVVIGAPDMSDGVCGWDVWQLPGCGHPVPSIRGACWLSPLGPELKVMASAIQDPSNFCSH